MSLEALLGTPVAFDARLQRVRGQAGQEESAALLRALLEDSEIRESHRIGDPRVQDAYSLRCMPQVHGPVLDAIRFAESLIGRELNAATDNPLVFEDGDAAQRRQLSTGRPVALALDLLAIVLDQPCDDERAADRPSRAPGPQPGAARRFWRRDAGLHSGFMMAQVTAAALASECKVLAHPASVDTIPTDGSKEDVVPMAMARGLEAPPRRAQRAARAGDRVDVRGTGSRLPRAAARRGGCGAGPSLVRTLVAPLEGDRVLSPDIVALAGAVAAGTFDDVTAAYTGRAALAVPA